MSWPRIATGSIIIIMAPGSRASNGLEREIPAIVLGQDPDDGMVTAFAFHFEGQYLSRVPPVTYEREAYIVDAETGEQRYRTVEKPNLRVVFDAFSPAIKARLLEDAAGLVSRVQVLEQRLADPEPAAVESGPSAGERFGAAEPEIVIGGRYPRT